MKWYGAVDSYPANLDLSKACTMQFVNRNVGRQVGMQLKSQARVRSRP
jgi:hypothetical protein